MTINDSLSIKNSSGAAVVVLNATNSAASVANNTVQQGYLQDLAYLPLASGKNLANGATGTAKLDGTYVDANGATKPTYIYNLLTSKPASLFPVMTASKRLDYKSMAYLPLEMTQAAADNMAKAFSFCQNIMTAPASDMAKSFQAVLTTAFKAGTITESEAQIAAFFNKYGPFKGLDFPSYVAVSTWMKGFAYAWGMDDKGAASNTYYIYSAPADGKTGTTSEGTIVFAPKTGAPSPADPTDRNSGMTINLTATDGTTTPLTFQSGQLIDKSGGAIALNCSWGYKGTFTGKGADTTVWPIIAGTMMNKKVIAIPLAPESGFSKFWSSLSFSKLFSYFMQAMGLWMALDFLKSKLSAKNEKLETDEANENNGEPGDPAQVEDAEKSAEETGDKVQAENQENANRVSPDDPPEVPKDDAGFESAVTEVRADGGAAFDQVATDNVSGAVESASEQLDALGEIENTPGIDSAMGDLVDANTNLSSGDVAGATESLGKVNTALPEIVDEMGTKVDADLAQSVEDAVEAQTEAADVAEETDGNSEATEGGTEEPFEDGTIPIE